MKKATAAFLIFSILFLTLTSCDSSSENNNYKDNSGTAENPGSSEGWQTGSTDTSDSDESFGDDLADTGIYDGYFEEEASDIQVKYISGTDGAYNLKNGTLTFSSLNSDSVYQISGSLSGNIVVDIGESFKLELELVGLSIVSSKTNPITVLSGDKVTLTAKKETENYIYDKREAVDESDETLKKGAIHSDVDLQIGGKGTLSVVSDNNNGIHTKDDLEVKNLTLNVVCQDNALKGNDSVTLSGGNITLISKLGDGIKTQNSDLSEKGNQRGTVKISDSTVTVYAACDGIDASYNTLIEGESTLLNIYTDKYSNYSDEVTATSGDVYYIRFTSNAYSYSVKYYNSDSDYEWVNATYHSKVSGGWSNYYYYSFPKKNEYDKMQFFIYSSDTEQGQDTDYLVASDYLTPNTTYDTFALSSRGNSLSYTWTNYTTSISGGGGFGGMNDGNSDKGDHSTKGIKAANEIIINSGTINIKSYDDSLHADNTATLENGKTALGNITVSGGKITLYSNDDGIHAEGKTYIKGGSINIQNSYEGVEGNSVVVSGGTLSITAKDDGINSTATSGTGITLSGGYVYIYCTGDGMDSNSRTSYNGISFEGATAVIIANSGMNSAIDTEQGYSYTGGSVIAIMPRGAMTNEAVHCQNFSTVGTTKTISFSEGQTVSITGDSNIDFEMPCSLSSAYVVILNKSININ